MKKKKLLSAFVLSAVLGIGSLSCSAMDNQEEFVFAAGAASFVRKAAVVASTADEPGPVVVAAASSIAFGEQKALFEEEAHLLMQRFSIPDPFSQVEEKSQVEEAHAALRAKAGVLLPFLTREFDPAMVDSEGKLLIGKTELEFYRWLYAHGIKISYRAAPIRLDLFDDTWRTNTFYNSATHMDTINYDSLQAGRFSQICKLGDIYYIRRALCRWELESPSSSGESFAKPILITPHPKDGHIFPIMHILDTNEHRLLCSFSVNSSSNNSYFDELERRFNMQDYYFISLDMLRSTDRIEQIPEAKKINKNIHCNWSIPFFDASYNLQIQQDDQNCAFYTYDTTLALLTLFEDEFVVQSLVEQARIIFECHKSPAAKEAADVVRKTLHEGLKRLLPQYYTPTGERRSFEEVRAYHLKRRWDITSDFLRRTLLN